MISVLKFGAAALAAVFVLAGCSGGTTLEKLEPGTAIPQPPPKLDCDLIFPGPNTA
jgi:hypothetical protein